MPVCSADGKYLSLYFLSNLNKAGLQMFDFNENIQYLIYLYHSRNPSSLWLLPTIFSPPHHNPLHWPRNDKPGSQVPNP